MYPYIDMTFNITRETKLFTVIAIDNTNRAGKIIPIDQVMDPPIDEESKKKLKHWDVNSWFLDAIYVESNCIKVGQSFGLPSFDEVDKYIQREHPEICAA